MYTKINLNISNKRQQFHVQQFALLVHLTSPVNHLFVGEGVEDDVQQIPEEVLLDTGATLEEPTVTPAANWFMDGAVFLSYLLPKRLSTSILTLLPKLPHVVLDGTQYLVSLVLLFPEELGFKGCRVV